MKSWLLFGCGILISLASWGEHYSGKARIVRSSPRTEVFFVDLKESYWIESDRKHNSFLKAFTDSTKKGNSVGFMADPETRKILAVDGVEAPVAVGELVTDQLAPAASTDAKKEGQK